MAKLIRHDVSGSTKGRGFSTGEIAPQGVGSSSGKMVRGLEVTKEPNQRAHQVPLEKIK